jgi:hypothetical protein
MGGYGFSHILHTLPPFRLRHLDSLFNLLGKFANDVGIDEQGIRQLLSGTSKPT